MSNCPLCQIVHGVKLSAVSNCPGLKLSAVLNCPVSNCPGVKLSANMGGVKLSVVLNIKLSWCQIVPGPFMLVSDPLWPSDERNGPNSPAKAYFPLKALPGKGSTQQDKTI